MNYGDPVCDADGKELFVGDIVEACGGSAATVIARWKQLHPQGKIVRVSDLRPVIEVELTGSRVISAAKDWRLVERGETGRLQES